MEVSVLGFDNACTYFPDLPCLLGDELSVSRSHHFSPVRECDCYPDLVYERDFCRYDPRKQGEAIA